MEHSEHKSGAEFDPHTNSAIALLFLNWCGGKFGLMVYVVASASQHSISHALTYNRRFFCANLTCFFGLKRLAFLSVDYIILSYGEGPN